MAPASHAHPWHYYIGLLTYTSSGGLRWSEGLVLVLACVGALTAWRRPERGAQAPSRGFIKAEAPPPLRAFWARSLTGYVAVVAAIFSIIPYKTPWNLLPFYVAAIVLAGNRVLAAPSRDDHRARSPPCSLLRASPPRSTLDGRPGARR